MMSLRPATANNRYSWRATFSELLSASYSEVIQFGQSGRVRQSFRIVMCNCKLLVMIGARLIHLR